jgi:hypothetical protein
VGLVSGQEITTPRPLSGRSKRLVLDVKDSRAEARDNARQLPGPESRHHRLPPGQEGHQRRRVRLRQRVGPLVLRSKPEIEKLFDGFTMEPPGLVQAPLWHPDADPESGRLQKIGIYAGVARN